MPYYPHSAEDINNMLDVIGKKELKELYNPIPEKYLAKSVDIGEQKSELEVYKYFSDIAGKNKPYKSLFLGAGAYQHYIPAAVDEICGRQEFYTAYTPYQAEISQGTLQAIFEYQTYICNLTGMDVSNASMYDGATSLAEAVIMAVSQTRMKKVLVDKFVHPEYLEVLKTYTTPLEIEVVFYNGAPYRFDKEYFKSVWSKDFACFVISSPNFLGSIVEYSEISDIVHPDKRAIIQNITEIISLSAINPPSCFGADIVCGEAQGLGNPISFGGPHLGFLACKKDYLRKMPGRIVGQANDKDGNIAYTLTLTAREQHIRRELASSNICSNHGLCAFRASVFMSILGKTGLTTLGYKNLENAHILQDKISKINGFSIVKEQAFFNEFVVKTEIPYQKLKDTLEKNDILSFYPLENIDSSLSNSYLVTSTEMNDMEDIDNFVKVLGGIK